MSAAADRPDAPSGEPTEPPVFDLEFMVDDPSDPTELTIFSPNDADMTTHWITVDIDTAVPTHAVR